ncbi:Probable serine/threonine-protein kinase DDB_G0281745 [Geodia barretti]|uniref:Probable serine/threonine-protein kinase DDB_G0281745 n=1 Tax=Geodia barretti TaxID=519541 RepID=A0AA35WUQ9_GEOBA|nr:Probable serine/threonine-protein kinase DDB_G0281745 [Geodia barretti]
MASSLQSRSGQLQNHSDLRSLVLRDVTLTGRTIGCGSYGSVEEVEIPGALCAAKKIHEFMTKADPNWLAKEVADSNVQKFLSECALLSRLRHPHVVQFLGLWFDKDNNFNVYLIMEKMMISLHDMLVPGDTRSTSTAHSRLPLGLKCSILQDTARGLAYLHTQNPPVIHRDLSARNVLLNSATTAKIADLGMAKIVSAKDSATMTKAPGALIYMPPEALEDSSRYSTSIDIFSLGVLVIFVLAEEFPVNLKAPTYTDEVRGLVARTELQRRENYTVKIYSTLPKSHALIRLMESCLENVSSKRPSIAKVLNVFRQPLAGIPDSSCSKLELLQLLKKSSEDHESLRKRFVLELEVTKKACKIEVDALKEEFHSKLKAQGKPETTTRKMRRNKTDLCMVPEPRVRMRLTGRPKSTSSEDIDDKPITMPRRHSPPPPLPPPRQSLQPNPKMDRGRHFPKRGQPITVIPEPRVRAKSTGMLKNKDNSSDDYDDMPVAGPRSSSPPPSLPPPRQDQSPQLKVSV